MKVKNWTKQVVILPAVTLVAGLSLFVGCASDGSSPITLGSIGEVVGGQWGAGMKGTQALINSETMGEKDENPIGESVGVAVTAQYGLADNAQLQKYVNLVGLTVVTGSPRDGKNWSFGVVNSAEINAFSGPNGYVMITRGAIEQMKDESELAGVLAHEIAHVCLQHGLNAVKNSQRGKALGEFAAAADAERGQLFKAAADVSVDAITKTGYDQPSEFAADNAGIDYVIEAGYDPHGLVNFLKRIEPKAKAGGGLSTHPGIDQRITKLEAKIAGKGNVGGATLAARFATWTKAK